MWTLVVIAVFSFTDGLEPPVKISWQSEPRYQYSVQCEPEAAEYSKELFRFAKARLPQGVGAAVEVHCELAPGRPA